MVIRVEMELVDGAANSRIPLREITPTRKVNEARANARLAHASG